jgi:alginate O-acetyltransferase complex protein AlgI
MSLNSWLFDYVYSQWVTAEGWTRGRFDLGLLIVFALSGLWHGATLPFLLWGLAHGVVLVLNRRWDEGFRALCRRDRAFVRIRNGWLYALAAWCLTMTWFVVSILPFHLSTSADLGAFLWGLAAAQGSRIALPEGLLAMVNVAAALGFFLAYHLAESSVFSTLRSRFQALPAPVRGAGYGLLVVLLMLFTPLSNGAFLYAQF